MSFRKPADSAPPDAVSVSARPDILFIFASLYQMRSCKAPQGSNRADQVKTRWKVGVLYNQVDASGVKSCLGTRPDLQEIDRKGRGIA
jgi:hypothetical protein